MKTPNSVLPPCSQIAERFLFQNIVTQYLCSVYMSGAYCGLQSRARCCHFAQQTGMLRRELTVAFPVFCSALSRAIGGRSRGTLSPAAGTRCSPLAPPQDQQGQLCWQRRVEKKNICISLFSLPNALYCLCPLIPD